MDQFKPKTNNNNNSWHDYLTLNLEHSYAKQEVMMKINELSYVEYEPVTRVTRAIPIDACGSNTIINSILFHSQKCFNLNNQLLHGHQVCCLKDFISFT